MESLDDSDGILEPSPSKRIRVQEILVDKAMDEFFTTIRKNPINSSRDRWIAASSSLPTLMSNEGENLCQKHLGDYIFLCVELNNEQLTICIIQYDAYKKSIIPSNQGVNMNLWTWYEFYHKLSNFNVCYTNASYIANNSILVLNIDGCMHIHNFNCKNYSKHSPICLNFSQIETLKEAVYEVNDVLMNSLLGNRLTYFIKREAKIIHTLTFEEEENYMCYIVKCVEEEIMKCFKKVLECSGCILNHPSQFLHSCITLTNQEKLSILGDTIFLLVNMEAIALNFVNHVHCVSESFVNNISIPYILNVIFKN